MGSVDIYFIWASTLIKKCLVPWFIDLVSTSRLKYSLEYKVQDCNNNKYAYYMCVVAIYVMCLSRNISVGYVPWSLTSIGFWWNIVYHLTRWSIYRYQEVLGSKTVLSLNGEVKRVKYYRYNCRVYSMYNKSKFINYCYQTDYHCHNNIIYI